MNHALCSMEANNNTERRWWVVAVLLCLGWVCHCQAHLFLLKQQAKFPDAARICQRAFNIFQSRSYISDQQSKNQNFAPLDGTVSAPVADYGHLVSGACCAGHPRSTDFGSRLTPNFCGLGLAGGVTHVLSQGQAHLAQLRAGTRSMSAAWAILDSVVEWSLPRKHFATDSAS